VGYSGVEIGMVRKIQYHGDECYERSLARERTGDSHPLHTHVRHLTTTINPHNSKMTLSIRVLAGQTLSAQPQPSERQY